MSHANVCHQCFGSRSSAWWLHHGATEAARLTVCMLVAAGSILPGRHAPSVLRRPGAGKCAGQSGEGGEGAGFRGHGQASTVPSLSCLVLRQQVRHLSLDGGPTNAKQAPDSEHSVILCLVAGQHRASPRVTTGCNQGIYGKGEPPVLLFPHSRCSGFKTSYRQQYYESRNVSLQSQIQLSSTQFLPCQGPCTDFPAHSLSCNTNQDCGARSRGALQHR